MSRVSVHELTDVQHVCVCDRRRATVWLVLLETHAVVFVKLKLKHPYTAAYVAPELFLGHA